MIKNYYGNNLRLDELSRELRNQLQLYKNYQVDAFEYNMNVDPHFDARDIEDHEKHISEIDEIIQSIEKLIVE